MPDNRFGGLGEAEDKGSETTYRYRYQDLCAVPLCAEALDEGSEIEAICPEYVQDIAVEETGRWRFIQVKTHGEKARSWTMATVVKSGAFDSLWATYRDVEADATDAGKDFELGLWLSGPITESTPNKSELLHVLTAHGDGGYLVDRETWIERIQAAFDDCSEEEAEQRIVELATRLTEEIMVDRSDSEATITLAQALALVGKTWIDDRPPVDSMEEAARAGLHDLAPALSLTEFDETFDRLIAGISAASSGSAGRTYAARLYARVTHPDVSDDGPGLVTAAKRLTRGEIRSMLRPLVEAAEAASKEEPNPSVGDGDTVVTPGDATRFKRLLRWALGTLAGLLVTQFSGEILDREFRWRILSGGLALGAAVWAVEKLHHPRDLVRTKHGVGVSLLTILAGLVIFLAPPIDSGPPEVVIMDSTITNQVYNEERQASGGSNSDDRTGILRALPDKLGLDSEKTSLDWDREDEVRTEEPDLIIIHASAFYAETDTGDGERKFGSFLEYMEPTGTKFLVYTRQAGCGEDLYDRYLIEYPFLDGRFDLMCMADNPEWNTVTGRDLKARVQTLLDLPVG